MKNFFTKKIVAFLSIMCTQLLILIILLIIPIGSLGTQCYVYSIYTKRFGVIFYDDIILNDLTSPFTLGLGHSTFILVWQTVVFTLVGIIFVVFLALFIVELKKAGVLTRWFAHVPTKSERLEARIDELEKQVDDLKKDE